MRKASMKLTGLKENERYYLIPQYTMKCRLYPNKDAAKRIDDAIYAMQSFYNCTVWEIYNNFACTNEREKKEKDGTVHFVDFKKIGSVEWKKKMITEHPAIACGVSSAITCKSGIIADMRKSFGKTPIEFQNPSYYCKKKPRNSYSYQEKFSKIHSTSNHNVLEISLAKVGSVKIRGWNREIRFDENGSQDFILFAEANPKSQVTVTVSKDNCGDYWICFKLQNIYKPMRFCNGKTIGVDVGIKDIAILSDGTKYKNRKFKKEQAKRGKALHRRLCRRQGWANKQFREKFKHDPSIRPSKRYEKLKLANAKLERKIARKRNLYNHRVSRSIVENNEYIAVETLNISGMFRNKHLSNALSDAAMGSILSMIGYKSSWHGRTVKSIDRWTPSSKRCSICGYILPKMPLSIREWDCPICQSHHDRDINASKNIKYFAFEQS